ncbi:MAG: thiamine-phosphate kinase [Gemmatimonas sp.]
MTNPNTPLGPGAEFDSIRAMIDLWGSVAHGIGDDAAILSLPQGQQLVVSTDATVEDVHFRKGWLSSRDVGARATVAALSDLAAMGARASSILVSLIVPDAWRDQLLEIASGIKHVAISAGANIVGGNIARGANFSLTLTVIGHANVPVKRSGAALGDALYVTGTLGGPQAAVAAYERGEKPPAWAIDRFVAPIARLDEGQWLGHHGARAMIDISDGLAAEAEHLAAANGLSVVLESEHLPRFPLVTAKQALAGGEEYELLVALSEGDAERIAHEFTSHFGLPLTRVGRFCEPNSPSRVELGGGHDHFST